MTKFHNFIQISQLQPNFQSSKPGILGISLIPGILGIPWIRPVSQFLRCFYSIFTTLPWLEQAVISRSLVLTRLFFPKQRNKRHQKAKQPSPQVYIKVGWLQWIWWLKHRVWLSLNSCKSENHPTKIYCSFSPTC